MALFGVISPIGTHLLYLALQSIEQARQDFVIPHRLKTDLGGNDGMGVSIASQVKLALAPSLLLAALAYLPFVLAVDIEPGGINRQMRHRPLSGQGGTEC